jgi:hypothetical protein
VRWQTRCQDRDQPRGEIEGAGAAKLLGSSRPRDRTGTLASKATELALPLTDAVPPLPVTGDPVPALPKAVAPGAGDGGVC